MALEDLCDFFDRCKGTDLVSMRQQLANLDRSKGQLILGTCQSAGRPIRGNRRFYHIKIRVRARNKKVP